MADLDEFHYDTSLEAIFDSDLYGPSHVPYMRSVQPESLVAISELWNTMRERSHMLWCDSDDRISYRY